MSLSKPARSFLWVFYFSFILYNCSFVCSSYYDKCLLLTVYNFLFFTKRNVFNCSVKNFKICFLIFPSLVRIAFPLVGPGNITGLITLKTTPHTPFVASKTVYLNFYFYTFYIQLAAAPFLLKRLAVMNR